MGLNSSSLPGDMSHLAFEYHRDPTTFLTRVATNQAFVARKPIIHEAAKQFGASITYTPSSSTRLAPRAEQQSMPELHPAQHHHAYTPQPLDLGQAVLSTISLDQHWLSPQGPHTGETWTCSYHGPVFQGNAPNTSRGLGPMARYFAAPPSEQYAIFNQPDSGDLSTSKGCRCLEILQLNIDAEEDTQE